jgi:hypothetical protein
LEVKPKDTQAFDASNLRDGILRDVLVFDALHACQRFSARRFLTEPLLYVHCFPFCAVW